jgi:hypothetical protein
MVRVSDLIGVPDSLSQDDSNAGLFVYNPVDGKLERTIEPVCKQDPSGYEDRPHYYDHILADQQAGALYWMLDSAHCLLRVGTGAAGGEQRIFNDGFQSIDEHNALVADGALYLSADKKIQVINANGEARLLISSEDYNLQPLEAKGDALLVLAQRTRGSSRLELWIIDLPSGKQRWARVLKAGDPISGPYDEGDFAAHLAGASVVLIEQQKEAKEVHFDLLSLKDGTSSVSTLIKVDDASSYIRGVTWGNHTAWIAMNELYGVSLEGGTTVSRWP